MTISASYDFRTNEVEKCLLLPSINDFQHSPSTFSLPTKGIPGGSLGTLDTVKREREREKKLRLKIKSN